MDDSSPANTLKPQSEARYQHSMVKLKVKETRRRLGLSFNYKIEKKEFKKPRKHRAVPGHGKERGFTRSAPIKISLRPLSYSRVK